MITCPRCRLQSSRRQCLALFIATPGQWKKHAMAPRQAAFLATHLNALQQALAERGIPLIYREVDDFAASVDTVAAVCAEEKVSHLFYNYQYEVNERQRDAAVEKRLSMSPARDLMTA
jgi:deoxyribodipyrimidine photo-lyase